MITLTDKYLLRCAKYYTIPPKSLRSIHRNFGTVLFGVWAKNNECLVTMRAQLSDKLQYVYWSLERGAQSTVVRITDLDRKYSVWTKGMVKDDSKMGDSGKLPCDPADSEYIKKKNQPQKQKNKGTKDINEIYCMN